MTANMLSAGFVNLTSEIEIPARGGNHATFVGAASRLIGFFLFDDFVAQIVSNGVCFGK
jgi:hypothetical protein